MKYLLRILAFPFALGMLLISFNYFAIRRAILFLLYGGEFISFENKREDLIQAIITKIKENK
jgi:hypothetical protein